MQIKQTPAELKKIQTREEDIKALLRADDENMPRLDKDPAGAPAEELRHLQKAERSTADTKLKQSLSEKKQG